MSDPITEPEAEEPAHPVTRLFPFVLKTGILLVGRDKLRSNRNKLHFILLASDIAEHHREEVLKDFAPYPIVQFFSAAELESFFNFKGAKAVGFAKSGLAQSIYAELKPHRINQPLHPSKPSGSPPVPPSEHKAE